MPEPVERKLAAILAADIVGYSRLIGLDEEDTLARLRALRRELIDPTIAEHRGRIFKTTGDGILVEFASVVDAVRCAVAVQRATAAREATFVQERRIEFRVGINLGDVVVEGDDILGDGVNIAARLEAIAAPGGICLSRAAFDQVEGKIARAFTDLGNRQLKNIARPVHVFAIDLLDGPKPQEQLATVIQLTSSPPRLSIVVLPFANIAGRSTPTAISRSRIFRSLLRLRISAGSTWLVPRRKPDWPWSRASRLAASALAHAVTTLST